MNGKPSQLPLSGITVVSLEQAIAAPLASRHLADWGARVIKIERPGKGDFCRDYDYVMNGMSSQFAWTNRSKESLALDVKSDEGKRVLDALLPQADVFLQNLAPGAAKRLGLDAATLVERFPRLIACDISGYGSGGPYSEKKAYDLLVQCEAGFLSVNGTEEQPAKCGIAVVDTATGMYIVNGVLMALFNRERTGKGMAFEVSLFDSMTEWMSYPAYYTDGAGKPLVRTGTRHATIAPYGPFRCGDGRRGVLRHPERARMDRALRAGAGGCGAGRAIRAFATNPQRMQNRDALEALIERHFAKFSAEQVMQRLDDAAIANANMNTVEAFLEHPQLHARDRVHKVGSPNGPLMSFLPAITIPGVDPVMGDIPAVGEHTDAILAELGLLEKAAIMTAPRLTRTYLAVPAHRARLVQNAAASAADAVFMDLEDAVPPAEKAAALEAAADGVDHARLGQQDRRGRLNAIDSPSIQTRDRAPRRHQAARCLHHSEGGGGRRHRHDQPLDHRGRRTRDDARRDGVADRDRARAGQCRGAGGGGPAGDRAASRRRRFRRLDRRAQRRDRRLAVGLPACRQRRRRPSARCRSICSPIR